MNAKIVDFGTAIKVGKYLRHYTDGYASPEFLKKGIKLQ
jgi:hypothetical protein